jgi:lipoate-protein ligase B
MLIIALAHLGVPAGQVKGMTGVWVQPDVYSRCPRCRPEDRTKPAKIAAIGVKVDGNGISRHGFALNIASDMSYWEGIIPCGISDHPVTCLADLVEILPPMETIVAAVSAAFGEVFGYEMKIVNSEDILSTGV